MPSQWRYYVQLIERFNEITSDNQLISGDHSLDQALDIGSLTTFSPRRNVYRTTRQNEVDLRSLKLLRKVLGCIEEDFDGLNPAPKPTNVMTNLSPRATGLMHIMSSCEDMYFFHSSKLVRVCAKCAWIIPMLCERFQRSEKLLICHFISSTNLAKSMGAVMNLISGA
jgi:hypothetical protein